MKIDKLLFEKSLEIIKFNYTKSVVKVNEINLEFFEEIGLNSELIEFLKQFSFLQYLNFGGIYFSCVNEIRTENTEEENKSIYKRKLLIVGTGMNGDPIVLNFETMKMGYVFHDELWENEEIENLDSIYINMNLSIGEFYYKKMTETNFPIDAYEAEEYMNK
jgi:hypothetical protein